MTEDFKELVYNLTGLERDVLIYTAKGFTAKEVGKLTCKTGKHIDQVRTRLMRKLNVSSSCDMSVIAAKAGLV